jgi:hypothetical protein
MRASARCVRRTVGFLQVHSSPLELGLDHVECVFGRRKPHRNPMNDETAAMRRAGVMLAPPLCATVDWLNLFVAIVKPGDRRNRKHQQQANSHQRQRHNHVEACNCKSWHYISRSGQKQVS